MPALYFYKYRALSGKISRRNPVNLSQLYKVKKTGHAASLHGVMARGMSLPKFSKRFSLLHQWVSMILGVGY
jgi:hypothetical protein